MLNTKKLQIFDKEERAVIKDKELDQYLTSIKIHVDLILKCIEVNVNIEEVMGGCGILVTADIGEGAHIKDIIIKPSLRGKGLGKQIYLKAEEILREYNVKKVTGNLSLVDCRTLEDMMRRNKFWISLGFKVKENNKGGGYIIKYLIK